MKQALKVLSEPPYEPVTLNEMKAWFRIELDVTEHDTVLRMLRQEFREYAENITGRAFVQRQYRLYIDSWPSDRDYGVKITLPFPPLVSVDAFRYVDIDGVLTTLATDQYVVHEEFEPGFIIPEWTIVWPTIRKVPDALQIDFTAGYPVGSPQDEAGYQGSIPASLKQWIEAKANTLNELREQVIVGTIVESIPRNFADGLLDHLVTGERLFG